MSAIYHKANRILLERPFRRRYNKVNEDFFKKFTPESSYVLGWLFSDGNVSKNVRTFGLHLQRRDIEVLEIIKNCLGSEHRIFLGKDGYLSFRVHSKKLRRDLVALGCVPRKAKRLKFPENLPSEYARHFVRGYFDGDGSISFNKPNVIKLRVVGYKDFIEGLAEALSKALSSSKAKIIWQPKSNIWQIEYYGDTARKLCNWMYVNSENLRLKRKYFRFINHLNVRGELSDTQASYSCAV